jgi:ABC-2 type transport system ATP-binding protein
MNFCRGFITDPQIVFLDEPTLGLDVNAARVCRDFTRDWLRRNPERTVLLTTHYMAEADELCDRIAIIDQGKVLACDTPSNLKQMLQRQPVFELTVSGVGQDMVDAVRAVPGVAQAVGTPRVGEQATDLRLILDTEPAIGPVVSLITQRGGNIMSLQKNEPTLEDVFVKLVGRSLSEEDKKEE